MADLPGAPAVGRVGLPLPPTTLAGFVVAVLAVVLITFISYRSLESRTNTAGLMTRSAQAVQRLETLVATLLDAETGQRGFLLTGIERYLEPYESATAALTGELKSLRSLTAGDPRQQQRLDTLEQLTVEKMQELAQTIALQRAGDVQGALAMVRTDRGKMTMDRTRALVAEMGAAERVSLAAHESEWQEAVRFSVLVAWSGSALLLALICVAAVFMAREYRARQLETWLLAGHAGLSARTEGGKGLDDLGENVLEFLAGYLDAQAGAIYTRESDGSFRRVAGYAVSRGAEGDVVCPGDGLLGQAAKEKRALHVRDLPEDYLPVSSSLGRGKPRELLVAPAVVDGTVQAVVELGFFRKVAAAERELLARVSQSLAMAVRSSKDRTRLEELLAQTQAQSEELQTQQEELRVSNEELEEQGNALRETQTRLENQQAELEATNAQLEATASDLERQKQDLLEAQRELRESAIKFKRASRHKSEFLANMSHELRTPLNSSLILARVLADNKTGNLSEEQVGYAKVIQTANNDLLTLINDILDLAKIEAGHAEVKAERTTLDDLLAPLRKSFEPLAAQKNLAFEIQTSALARRSIDTDLRRVNQILRNLLSNAFKFTEAGKVGLRVEAAAAGTIAFAVEDTGIGIAQDQQETIFEAFHQADGSVSRKYGGTGLGLSISRELARVLGGTVEVKSTPGVGSVFTLIIPVSIESTQVLPGGPTERPASPPAPTGEGLRSTGPQSLPAAPHIDDDRARRSRERLILVVEDDPHFASILYGLAHELDLDCVHTTRAADAPALAREFKPSGILLDIGLPDGSGLSVLERLKRDPLTRHIPVHMITAYDQAQPALELGAVGYTMKPAARDELAAAMENLKRRRNASLQRILIVEDDESLRSSIALLLEADDVEIAAAGSVAEALTALERQRFDCMIIDLALPDGSGFELLERMARDERYSAPPVIVYTGRALTPEDEQRLRRYSGSIIIKGARSPERLLDEVTLFLHRVESTLPADQQALLREARQRDAVFEGRRILLAEDDVRNIYALQSVFEPLGATLEIARNGREALARLTNGARGVDLVLMDVMMPEMDGLTATREIRKLPGLAKLPIIAVTAKAMPEDRQACLDAGANDYVSKPIDLDKLLSLCRVWMRK